MNNEQKELYFNEIDRVNNNFIQQQGLTIYAQNITTRAKSYQKDNNKKTIKDLQTETDYLNERRRVVMNL